MPIYSKEEAQALLKKVLSYSKAEECEVNLSGRDGGKMNGLCDLNIIIPSDVTARIQEMHILIGHILCKAVDNEF